MFFSMGYSNNIFAGGFGSMWGRAHYCSHRSPMYSPAMGVAFLTALMGRSVQPSMSFSYRMPVFSMPYNPMFMYPSYSGFSTSFSAGVNKPFDFSMNYKMFNPFMNFNSTFSFDSGDLSYNTESSIAMLNRLHSIKSTKKSTVKTQSVPAATVSGEKKSADKYSLSSNGVELIKEFEGCRLTAYKCSANTWTIGYGHTKGVKEGQTITQAEADNFLKSDIKEFEGYVKSAVKVPLTQNQFDALVSFTYNVGPGNLQKSTLLKKLNNGDYEGAAAEFAVWNKAGGKELNGLTRRREAERKLFCS